jgi:hypothetical protein
LSPPEIYFGTNAQKQGAVCQLKNSVLLKTNTTKTNTNNHAKSKMPYLWAFTPKALSLRHMLATSQASLATHACDARPTYKEEKSCFVVWQPPVLTNDLSTSLRRWCLFHIWHSSC